ncbi:hypothetical protein [Pseudomonas phage KP1]|uniref:Major tail tube protein n=1 Tax=Pseudomonas phage KP1 TaxID=2562463 RepID=A0A6G5QAK3_9CAUD|nr:hypothetical protein PM391_gp14 [Pseudomonas phage KP1]QBZ71754.1 hypothetical protein [Pseudomonas phage KP1]
MPCEIAKIDSNITGLAYAEEECLKQLPGVGGADAVWRGLEPNSYSDFGGELSTVARAPIDPSRQNKKGTITDLDASGGFNSDFTKTNLTRLMQGFFFADAREMPSTRPMNAAAIAISGVVASTKTYTIASGGAAFVAGMLVFASGFANAANNGVKTVASSTGTTIVVNEVLVDEASPPAGVKIEAVGRQLASADANIAVTGSVASLIVTAGDFTTMPELFPGRWLFLGGDAVGNRFANNVGFARIASVAAKALIFDDVTWTAANETGTGKTIRLFVGTVIKNEKDPALIKRRSYNIERQLGNGENGVQAEYLEGAVANEFTLNIPQAEKLNADISFIACDNTHRSGDPGDTIKAGSRISAPGEDAYNTSSDVYRIKMHVHDAASSNPSALFGYVSEASVSINNSITPNKAVGILGAFDVSAGNFEVGGSITAYFTTVAAVKAVRANADVGLSVIVAAKNAGFLFDIPLLGLGGGRLNVEKDAPITVPLEPAGAENANGYTMLYETFAYLPSVAMPD